MTVSTIATEVKKGAWFCLRSQPKHEHIVAAHLRKMEEVEVFLPRIRFKRMTRQRSGWVTEALFPGYLFTRFDWRVSLRRVQYAPGARGIVHFGTNYPILREEIIEELSHSLGETELHTIHEEFSPGDAVQVADGTLRGLRAVISRVMPGQRRITVLMELLGQQATVELATHSLIREDPERAALLPVATP